MPAVVPFIPLITGALGVGASVYGASQQSGAQRDASRLQTQAAQQAAELEAQAAAQSLAFQKQQAELAERNFRESQAYNRKVYTDQQARLAPYRQFGTGALSQLSSPIPGMER